ncbi:AMP-binding protein, partial [Pseudomonas syringae]
YPLTLSVDDLGQGFDLHVLSRQGMGAERIADWMLNAIAQLVLALEQGLPEPLQSLSILHATERERLLIGFNASALSVPQDLTVHAQVEARAVSSPHAHAVVQGAEVLTYAELNRRANQLAHYLIELGVQPDERVALC